MSEESSKYGFYKSLIIGGSLILLLVMEWIQKHPLTTLWIVCVLVFVAYLIVSRNSPTPPTSSGDDTPKDYH